MGQKISLYRTVYYMPNIRKLAIEVTKSYATALPEVICIVTEVNESNINAAASIIYEHNT